MIAPTDPSPDASNTVRAHVAAVAAMLNADLSTLVGEMRASLASEIAELNSEPSLIDLLGSSIEGNVDTILHALQYNIGEDGFEPPAAAFEYARRLAQWGVSVNALVRAYRLGQQFLIGRAFETSLAIDTSDSIRVRAHDLIVDSVFDYIDWISQRVVVVYETERESWLADRENARLDAVLDLLGGTGSVKSVERVTGYRLHGRHLAVVAWTDGATIRDDRLRRFTTSIRSLAGELGSPVPPLVVGRDGATAWGWIQITDGDAVAVFDRLNSRPRTADAPLLAAGTVATGADGFVHSHQQAQRAHHVAVLGRRGRSIERYDDPGLAVVDLCAHDPSALQAWVLDVLGPELAADTDQSERLRTTLRVYLACERSLTAAASVMTMHKNSIRYRVDNAEKLLPTPISGNRLAVEVALTACHWLGARVLTDDQLVPQHKL
ncbi:putative uncharacterized protein [Rhodococcus sp. AW25M09]|uniref:PucR family transcriptional regulator n=1 Tax=Rhodococcus sp. AW25M09 TaxID=1268303 RepID=UPI0002AC2CC3|nr:helix-turn-helix domain-containing protein [Rhodococcus sp. AW25M09]CCQ13595.1 putative uncharacterized protein [Rhodococcus sp. AW25M09]